MNARYAKAIVAFSETVQRMAAMVQAIAPEEDRFPIVDILNESELILAWHHYTTILQTNQHAQNILAAVRDIQFNTTKEAAQPMAATTFTLAQLRQWIIDQIGIAEVTRVQVPPDAGLGTTGFFSGPSPDPGTMSGSEQIWANIVTNAGTDPDNSGPVQVKVIPWGGGTESDWMDPGDVAAYVAGKQ